MDQVADSGRKRSDLRFGRTAIFAMVMLALAYNVVTMESSTAGFSASSGNPGSSFATGYWRLQSVASGNRHSCAALSTGVTKCWGTNDKGQLGDNTTSNSSTPVTVVGSSGSGVIADLQAVAAGNSFSCGAKTDGTAWCWGLNDRGQLGNNTTTDSLIPVQVVGPGGSGLLSDVASISAGLQHVCAAKSDGTVWCWGLNDQGQLGNGTTTNSSSPVQVDGVGGTGTLAGIDQVDLGQQFSCAAALSGSVYCWGFNSNGQLGDNTKTNRPSPVQVVDVGGTGTIDSVTMVGAGQSHTCASKSDETAWCWGRNDKGQLGNNTTTDSDSPVQVSGVGGTGTLSSVSGIGSGRNNSCALLTTREAKCWGANTSGILGDGTMTDSSSPVQVVGPGGTGTLTDIMQLTGSLKDVPFTCAIKINNTVWCWGKNNAGALGDGTTNDSLYPVQALT